MKTKTKKKMAVVLLLAAATSLLAQCYTTSQNDQLCARGWDIYPNSPSPCTVIDNDNKSYSGYCHYTFTEPILQQVSQGQYEITGVPCECTCAITVGGQPQEDSGADGISYNILKPGSVTSCGGGGGGGPPPP